MRFIIYVQAILIAEVVSAQNFTNLYNLSYSSDGAYPEAGLVLSGSTLYGTAGLGGSAGAGTVFAVNADGTHFTNLHSFANGARDAAGYYTNNGGAFPLTGLTLSGTTLYGTTREGGSGGVGTIFQVNTDGTGFTNLHVFTALPVDGLATNSDGIYPRAGLLLSGDTLYGSAGSGGNHGAGTLFALKTDGTGFTILKHFTFNDGARPAGNLILSGAVLYGTACQGGTWGNGVVFSVNIAGTEFTNLHVFTATDASGANSDGSTPLGGVITAGNTLYGTAAKAGTSNHGTVFKMGMNGTGFATLHAFDNDTDGNAPVSGLILYGNTLFGTAGSGGSSGAGTLFCVDSDGKNFRNLHHFAGISDSFHTNSEGANPEASLVLSGNTLFGTAVSGGSWGFGTIFRLFVQPQLKMSRSEGNVVLAWPANSTGFILQTTTNLIPPTLWRTAFPEPVVVNGEAIVTNAISDAQQFYRLAQ